MKAIVYFSVRHVALMARAIPKIGTHDGAFHCDEALGCWMLRRTKRFKEGVITRTRKEEVLKTMDVVLDVGGIYDPGTGMCFGRNVISGL